MMRVLMVCGVVFLSACEIKEPQPDQELRAKLFMQCMERVPKGPERTGNSNDWDEVVHECGRQAYYLSLRGGRHNLK